MWGIHCRNGHSGRERGEIRGEKKEGPMLLVCLHILGCVNS